MKGGVFLARNSFFDEMLLVKDCLAHGTYEIDGKVARYSKATKSIFNRLVSFVESCSFTNAKATKFFCGHWSVPRNQLLGIYNIVMDANIVEATLRGHISRASSLLYGLCPTFSADIFISENKEALYNLEMEIEAVEFSSILPEDLFIFEVCAYTDYRANSKSFNVSECEKELALLRLLTKSAIFKKIDGVDPDKLAFVLNTLVGRMVGVHDRTINEEKLAVLRGLSLIGNDSAFLEETKSVSSEALSEALNADPTIVGNVGEVEEAFVPPYKLGITEEMFKILQERLVTEGLYDTADTVSENPQTPEEKIRQKRYQAAQNLIQMLTLEGFRERLNNLNRYDLVGFLNSYKND